MCHKCSNKKEKKNTLKTGIYFRQTTNRYISYNIDVHIQKFSLGGPAPFTENLIRVKSKNYPRQSELNFFFPKLMKNKWFFGFFFFLYSTILAPLLIFLLQMESTSVSSKRNTFFFCHRYNTMKWQSIEKKEKNCKN